MGDGGEGGSKLTLSKTVCSRGISVGCSLGTNSSSTSPNNRYLELHRCLYRQS